MDAAAAAAAPGELLLTADTVVVCAGRILEKPRDAGEALRMIAGYAEHPCQVVTAVCAERAGGGGPPRARGRGAATVTFLPGGIPVADAEALVAEGEVMWCA